MSESRRARSEDTQRKPHPRERLYSKFQERGDARVNQERSVRKDAIVADRSAHDTAKQATISELEAAMKTFVMKVDTAREQRDRRFSRAREGEVTCEDHAVVNYLPVDRGHLPRTNNHEVAQCWVVVLEEARNEPRSRKRPQSDAGGTRRSQEATCSAQMAQITMSSEWVQTGNRKNHDQQRQWWPEEERHMAERSTKSKKDDGRWVTILRGPNPSEQRRNDEKESKEHGQQQARQEQSQQPAREEHRQQQAKEEQEDLWEAEEESMKHTEDLHFPASGQRGIHQQYIENREPEKSRKSMEDEKLKSGIEEKMSEAALKRDRSCPGSTERV